MGMKRRTFLLGAAAVVAGGVGAGVFTLRWLDGSMKSRAAALTVGDGEASFAGWLKIASDDAITVYSPHIDFGQGAQTALAQMLADELDADWPFVRVEQAPAEEAFANTAQVRAALGADAVPGFLAGTADSGLAMLARQLVVQGTGGSSSVRDTGQWGMRMIGAAARQSLLEAAAEKLSVPVAELSASKSVISHAPSNRALRYGELAIDAAQRSLSVRPVLKDPKAFTLIGKTVKRLDVPPKVNGTAIYGIDFVLPEMRVATVMAAPVRGGKLKSVLTAPAMAIKGVEKVISLSDAVVVVAKGYWQAINGLRALSPVFDEGGNGGLSSAGIDAEQAKLRATGRPTSETGLGDFAKAIAAQGVKRHSAEYRLPFLHHATMEPLAMTAHYDAGRLHVWGGAQDPLLARGIAAEAAGLAGDAVTFHPMIMGGGFGRRFPYNCQIIGQVARLAMQLPYPVKLIWSREEDVAQGAYRPQCSARLEAAVSSDGRVTAWSNDYVQFDPSDPEAAVPYSIPAARLRHYQLGSNQQNGFWRSVHHSQHGFYTECFMDELAEAAGADPYEFRRSHLPEGSRHRRVLEEVAKRSAWTSPRTPGVGRGIALVESFGSIAAEVVEASLADDGTPVVRRVFAVVDCGRVVSPRNAEAQVQGAIIMGLSAAIGEQITLDKGAVVQSNFSDYPILQMAAAPKIDVHFIDSGAPFGGLGEPGLPPVAPALANALFALNGKRIRQLPLVRGS
jgi:isoquinoline 1-oxidoreductase subunit beta